MWIVNENVDTRRLTLRTRASDEDREPDATDPVAEEVEVEFQENGRARVSQEVGERLIEQYEPIREASGPEDVAAEYERRREAAAEAEAEEESTPEDEE